MAPDMTTPLVPRTVPLMRRALFTVLLVDDDPLVLQVMKATLGYAGYAVLACASGATALALFSVRPGIHALLTDFQMPEMTGFELAQSLTARRPGLPVVVMSGSAREDLPLDAIAEARWHYLPKPLNRSELIGLLDGVCGV